MTTPVPDGLAAAGSALWGSIVGKYDLRPDELVTLEAACRASDRIVDLERERGGQTMSTGSMGQAVVHPAIPEIRATEAQVASLLARLKLPDSGGVQSGTRSTQARAAAQSRWAAAHGKGA